jgi:hypothetical protein
MTIQTHYENLSIARNAPSEVIRAAYKVLSQKYESDQNQNAEASNLLESINLSYSILSNPVKKAEYDQWLEQQSQKNQHGIGNGANKNEKKLPTDNTNTDGVESKESSSYRWLLFSAIGLAAVIAVIWFGFMGNQNNTNTMQSVKAVESANNLTNQTTSESASTPLNVETINIPAHDPVAMDKFIGSWKGVNETSSALQTLELSMKSPQSMVFLLDAKAGQGIGGIYGVAEFKDNFARFFNEEYGCVIIFTIKADILNVSTSECQAYHAKGVSFDGDYRKPGLVKVESKTTPTPTKPVSTKTAPVAATQPVTMETAPVVAKNMPKLVKFSVTVKDSEGNENTFEMVAKDKKSAKEIIRDFRGNPKILKIKEVKN